jgi:hypothetical protein
MLPHFEVKIWFFICEDKTQSSSCGPCFRFVCLVGSCLMDCLTFLAPVHIGKGVEQMLEIGKVLLPSVTG